MADHYEYVARIRHVFDERSEDVGFQLAVFHRIEGDGEELVEGQDTDTIYPKHAHACRELDRIVALDRKRRSIEATPMEVTFQ